MAIGNLFGAVINLVFAIVVITEVLIPTFLNANQTGWSAAEIALWSLGSLAAIAGTVYFTFRALGME